MRYLMAILGACLLQMAGPQPAQAQYADDATALIESWYQTYLGRLPDPDGFATYMRKLRSGIPPVELQAEILSSDEFYRRWGSTPRGFISGLYRVVRGRRPSPEEFRFWMRRFARDGDRAEVALELLESGRRYDPYPMIP